MNRGFSLAGGLSDHPRVTGSRAFDCWTLEWTLASPGRLELDVFFQGSLAQSIPFTVPGKTWFKSSIGSDAENIFEPRLAARGDSEHGELSGTIRWICAGKEDTYQGSLGTW